MRDDPPKRVRPATGRSGADPPRVRDLPAPRRNQSFIGPLFRRVFAWPYRMAPDDAVAGDECGDRMAAHLGALPGVRLAPDGGRAVRHLRWGRGQAAGG